MDIEKEREAFEAWFESQFESTKLDKFDDGVYWHERAQMSWEAWQAAKVQAVPEGFVVVPKEPTESMLDASMRRQWDEPSSPYEDMDLLKYKAMIAAAQEPTNESE